MLWTAIHLPNLGLEVFRPAQVLASGRAMVLVDEQKITGVNQEASQAGIQAGSNLATAYSLLTDLEHFTRDQRAEQQRLQDLVTTVYQFSPAVSIAQPSSLLLEVAGSLNLFRGLPSLLRQLKRHLNQRGHLAQLGVAHTPHAALALAKSDATYAWPDFPTNEEIRQAAAQLLQEAPLICADLSKPIVERLANMGLRSLGELLALPRHELGSRFDTEFIVYLDKLAGDTPDIWPWEEPIEQFVVERHLLEPIRDKGALLQPMALLIKELCAWLNPRFLGVKSLRWWFATFERTGVHMTLSFAEPQAEATEILTLTELKYDDMDLPEDVMTIRLEVVDVDSLTQRSRHQRNLFGDPQMKANAPTGLLDRLAIKLGKQTLRALNQLDDHRPEYAWSPVFPTETVLPAEAVHGPGKRPLWLLEPPKRVQLKHFQVLTSLERIEGGWWDQPLSRDYFVARHESGAICWIYRDVTGWYQHGYFA